MTGAASSGNLVLSVWQSVVGLTVQAAVKGVSLLVHVGLAV